MVGAGFVVQRAGLADFDGWFDVYEAVAAEGKWVGGELPVDRESRRQSFVERFVDGNSPGLALVARADAVDNGRAVEDGRAVGHFGMTLEAGIAEFGMAIVADWRGRRVGSALLASGVDWARERGAHKVALQLWPHNAGARRLYEKFGFVEEGHLRRHYRRANGEVWDALIMGLVLDTTSPGSPW